MDGGRFDTDLDLVVGRLSRLRITGPALPPLDLDVLHHYYYECPGPYSVCRALRLEPCGHLVGNNCHNSPPPHRRLNCHDSPPSHRRLSCHNNSLPPYRSDKCFVCETDIEWVNPASTNFLYRLKRNTDEYPMDVVLLIPWGSHFLWEITHRPGLKQAIMELTADYTSNDTSNDTRQFWTRALHHISLDIPYLLVITFSDLTRRFLVSFFEERVIEQTFSSLHILWTLACCIVIFRWSGSDFPLVLLVWLQWLWSELVVGRDAGGARTIVMHCVPPLAYVVVYALVTAWLVLVGWRQTRRRRME